ncbi:hypothetical protein TGFOU_405860, partial [Toxoplasma gondii FOU]
NCLLFHFPLFASPGKRTRHPGGRWRRRAGGLSCTKKDGLRKTPRDCLWFDHAYTRFVGPVA